MMRMRAFIVLVLVMRSPITLAQAQESPLNMFGYFQTSFQHWTELKFETSHPAIIAEESRPEQNSFSIQQLNLFLSKDLAQDWRAFVNFEILNTFSSSRLWGAFNLEEAWVRYKPSDKLNVKVGLLIPVFNNFNEIKNRTPLLPYVIRPLVYETSFAEFFPAVEEGAPSRAFVQASGILPIREGKFDYAFYIGNSPNISSRGEFEQTGVDVTNTFLVGGRIGFRFNEVKAGFSATRDNVNRTGDVYQGEPLFTYEEVPRTRLGVDLSFHLGRLFFEGEFISVMYKDVLPRINNDGLFYYGTVGYRITEEIFPYFSYWRAKWNYPFIASTIPVVVINTATGEVESPTLGISFHVNDRITFKGQYIPVLLNDELPIVRNLNISTERRLYIIAFAASVYF